MATDARGNLISPMVMPVAMYRPNSYGWVGMGQMLPANLQTVKFADGTTGFLDPADGTYYDSQGNDVTGYVQNFGGATITGTATAAQIAAAEGITPPSSSLLSTITSSLAPGPSPRVTVPAPGAGVAAPALTLGLSTETIAIAGVGLVLAMMMMGGGGRRR